MLNLEERIFRFLIDAQSALVADKQVRSHRFARAIEVQRDTVAGVFLQLLGYQHRTRRCHAVHCHHAVARLHTREVGSIVRHDGIYHKRHKLRDEDIGSFLIQIVVALFLSFLPVVFVLHSEVACAEVLRHHQFQRVRTAKHHHVLLAFYDKPFHHIAQALWLYAVDCQYLILLTEALLLQKFRVVESRVHVVQRHGVGAPREQNQSEHHQRGNKIDQYTAQDDEQALPSRL